MSSCQCLFANVNLSNSGAEPREPPEPSEPSEPGARAQEVQELILVRLGARAQQVQVLTTWGNLAGNLVPASTDPVPIWFRGSTPGEARGTCPIGSGAEPGDARGIRFRG